MRGLDTATRLSRALSQMMFTAEYADYRRRFDAGQKGDMLARAGLWRTLKGDLESAVLASARPDWKHVRRLHAAYVLSDAWTREKDGSP